MYNIDRRLFLAIYNFTSKNKILKNVSTVITNASFYIFFGVYLISSLYMLFRTEFRIKFWLVPFLAIAFNMIFRKLMKRARPFDELGTESLVEHGKSYSFPSNHSASAMVIAFAVLSLNLYFGLILMGLAFVTGLSRIMTGLHYPADVIAGFLVGGIFGSFILF